MDLYCGFLSIEEQNLVISSFLYCCSLPMQGQVVTPITQYPDISLIPALVISLEPYPMACLFNSVLDLFHHCVLLSASHSNEVEPIHQSSTDVPSASNLYWKVGCSPASVLITLSD